MSIYDTFYGTAINLRGQAERTYPFLVANRHQILLTDDELQEVANLRNFGRSGVLNLFRLVAGSNGLAQFAVMDLRRTDDSVPDILDIDTFTVDGHALKGAPTGFDRVWVNLTPVLKRRKSPNDPLTVSDVPRACGYFVRGGFVATYHAAQSADRDWLPLKLGKFAVESYSMAVALMMRRLYNLNYNDEQLVRIIFAYFFACRMGKDYGNEIPPVLMRCTSLGRMADIREQLEKLQEVFTSAKDLASYSLQELFTAIPKLGSGRLANATSEHFTQLFTQNPHDSQLMAFAIDYPPYWVYQILRYMAGARNAVIGPMMNFGSFKRDAAEFATELEKFPNLLHV